MGAAMAGQRAESGPEAPGRWALPLATLAILGLVTATTMVGPLLVDLSSAFDVPLSLVGLLTAAMSLPWALGAPLAGLLSDRVGRRPLIALALAGVGLCSLLTALANDFATLLALRFLAGLFGALGPASLLAALGDLFPARRRAMAMSWFNLGFSLAAVAGTPIVGVVGGLLGWRAAFVAVGGMLLIMALLVRLGFPARRPNRPRSAILTPYRSVVRVPLLSNVLGANLLERSIFSAATLYLPSFLMLSYGLTAAEVAPALSVVALGAIAGNVLGGWLGDRLRKPLLFVVAQATAGAIGLALFGAPLGLVASALGGAAFGVANAASRPAFLALGSELSSEHRGAVLGLFSLTNHGGFVVGSALGGLTIALGGYPGLGTAVALSGGLAALCALPLWRRR